MQKAVATKARKIRVGKNRKKKIERRKKRRKKG